MSDFASLLFLNTLVVGGGEWQTEFSVSPGPGLWSLVLGTFGPDLGPGPELDNIFLTCRRWSETRTDFPSF